LFAASQKTASAEKAKTYGKDFALKRQIPGIKGSFVSIQDFDTPYDFSRVQDASAQALRQMVFEENFALARNEEQSATAHGDGDIPVVRGTDVSAAVQPEHPNLYTMTDSEFNDVLNRARSMRDQYSTEVERFPTRKGSLNYAMQILNVNADDDANAESFPCSFGYLSAKAERLRDSKVCGRILNRVPGGFAVGLGGAVGFLPQLSPEEFAEYALSPDDRLRTYDFYLQDLRWSREGKPHIVVSMRPLSATAGLHAATADDEMETATQSADAHTELQSLLDEILASATKNSAPDDNLPKQRRERQQNAKPMPQQAESADATVSSNAELQSSLADFLQSLDKKKKSK
jgi:hypothetical protein